MLYAHRALPIEYRLPDKRPGRRDVPHRHALVARHVPRGGPRTQRARLARHHLPRTENSKMQSASAFA